jgi:hypothetical protein
VLALTKSMFIMSHGGRRSMSAMYYSIFNSRIFSIASYYKHKTSHVRSLARVFCHENILTIVQTLLPFESGASLLTINNIILLHDAC